MFYVKVVVAVKKCPGVCRGVSYTDCVEYSHERLFYCWECAVHHADSIQIDLVPSAFITTVACATTSQQGHGLAG